MDGDNSYRRHESTLTPLSMGLRLDYHRSQLHTFAPAAWHCRQPFSVEEVANLGGMGLKLSRSGWLNGANNVTMILWFQFIT
jgi:hypothetical protein